MADSFSRPSTAPVSLDDEQGGLRYATCPGCHTATSVTQNAIEAGANWRCVRCGQHWDAARLAAVARYAASRPGFDRRAGTP
jgi:predicted Zn finger-like uncharacterized protein